MRRIITIIAAAGVWLGAAQAERQTAPVRPYAPVVVTLAQPKADATLDAFRQELAKVAKGRIYAKLARLTAEHGFFWGRDFGKGFDRRKPGVDNLAAAVRLEHNNGSGWIALAELAGDAGVLPLESRPGVVCAPSPPGFDAIAFDRLINDTRTEASDWSYPKAADTAVRAAPQSGAAVIETLGLHFVRVLDRDGEAAARGGWTRVVAPGGDTGFVAPGALRSLGAPRLCYGKDPTDRWQIVGFIDRDD